MNGKRADRTVRKWESGELDIPGYVQIIIDLAIHVPVVRDRLGIARYQPEPGVPVLAGPEKQR
jgi:hypothetical protein